MNEKLKTSDTHATTDGGSILHHIWASIAFTVTLGIACCVFYPAVVWGIAQAVFPFQANGSLVKRDGSHTTDQTQAVGSYLLGQNFSLPGYFHPRPSAAGNGYDPTSSGGSNLGPLSDKLINGLTTSPTAPATQPAEALTYDGVRLRTLHYAADNSISFKLYHVTLADLDAVRDDKIKQWIPTAQEVPLSKFSDAQGNLNDIALVDAFPHPQNDKPDRVVLVAGDFAQPIPGDAVTASGSGLDPHISPDNAAIQAARVAAARGISVDKVQALIDKNTDKPGLGFLGDPGVNVLMLNLALDAAYPLPAPPATQPSK
jgi:K+-transporting ATPase ATPase C chain